MDVEADNEVRVSRWEDSFRIPSSRSARKRGGLPTFSVVVAAYQAAAFVGEAVESALAQTAPPHEIIVCDDGSTDDIEAALAPYRHRIMLLRKEQGGPASARNVAARAASGEFVVVLDADDAYLPERLEALGELASRHPQLDILATDAYYELDGSFVGRFNKATEFEVLDQRSAILERCFCAWPALRRSKLLASGGFDETLATGEDWDCAIRLIFGGCLAGLVDEPLYRYRIRRDSVTADRVGTLRDRITLLEKAREQLHLSSPERGSLERSLDVQRRSLLLTEAEAALRAGDPQARRLSLAVATNNRVDRRTRTLAIASALAPRLSGRLLERRARRPGGGGSRLARPVPRS